MVNCQIGEVRTQAIRDTGSQVSIVSKQWKDLHLPHILLGPRTESLEAETLNLTAANEIQVQMMNSYHT